MSKQKGFTLIELVIVIAILGILAAIAIPKYVNLTDDALQASKKGMSGAVKSAHAIAIADTKDFPDVTVLASYVNGENVTPLAGGVQVDIDGTLYTVPTYTAANCAAASVTTAATGQKVQCVGNIPHP